MARIKCFFGMHKWVKFMGPRNEGGGKFSQKYKCVMCGKIKEEIK
ncbi:MAG: hypothetical protein ABIH49_02865 [archaeon]